MHLREFADESPNATRVPAFSGGGGLLAPMEVIGWSLSVVGGFSDFCCGM